MRKDVITEAACVKDVIFAVFTNGTLIDDFYLNLFDRNRNIVPVLSLEGDRKQTEARRGDIYDNLMAALRKVCAEFGQEGGEPLVNTGHFLLYLLRSRKFASSQVLSTFNIPRNLVAEMISDLPFDEDYYMEMNALRNIRILRIDPKDTGYGGTAGDGRERPDEEDTERNDVKP